MPNPNPKTAHLPKQTSKWFHIPTKPIRVPEAFAPEVEAYARALDQSERNTATSAQNPPQAGSNLDSTSLRETWLGIRPSVSQMGWAVLWGNETEYPQVLDSGVIETDSKQPFAQRLAEIEGDLSALLIEFRPHRVALENPIVDSSFPSARKLLQCLGVMELVIYRYGHLVPLKLYRATWKDNIGEVKADKDEVLESVAGLGSARNSPSRRSGGDRYCLCWLLWVRKLSKLLIRKRDSYKESLLAAR